jgi:hypothetical protein
MNYKMDKPWFDEGCSELLGQGRELKLQWLQDVRKINMDVLNNLRHVRFDVFRAVTMKNGVFCDVNVVRLL